MTDCTPIITLDAIAKAETAVRRQERVVATRQKRLKEEQDTLDVLRAELSKRAEEYAKQAGGGV